MYIQRFPSAFVTKSIPYAEKYNVKLALHPDDPPLERLGDVERIMIRYENIKKAVNIVNSPNLGVTMCQATYLMMGENLYDVIPMLSDKIFFIHLQSTAYEIPILLTAARCCSAFFVQPFQI